MPHHRITPDVLTVASRHPVRAAARRPSATAWITARLRAATYDRLLAVGVIPEPGSPLAAHHARLTSTAERHAIAESLRRAVCDRDARPSSRIPVHVPNITAAEHLIDRVIVRLHSPLPVSALGMARLRLVLSDGAGPLYRWGRGDLPGRLGAALAEL